MSRVLVVYGSKYGQTERVAHRIAGVLSDAGHVVDIYKGDQVPETLSLADYDGFLVAASVLMGQHQDYIRDFVRQHAKCLKDCRPIHRGIGTSPSGTKWSGSRGSSRWPCRLRRRSVRAAPRNAGPPVSCSATTPWRIVRRRRVCKW